MAMNCGMRYEWAEVAAEEYMYVTRTYSKGPTVPSRAAAPRQVHSRLLQRSNSPEDRKNMPGTCQPSDVIFP